MSQPPLKLAVYRNSSVRVRLNRSALGVRLRLVGFGEGVCDGFSCELFNEFFGFEVSSVVCDDFVYSYTDGTEP